MIPRLFPADEATKSNAFKTNGLGGLGDAISCIVTEEKNGQYELELVYPVDGIHFSEIENDMLIMAKPNETSNEQIFRIYKMEKPINGQVTINAEHISYLLTRAVMLPFEAGSASGAFQDIQSNVLWETSNPNFPTFPFTFWTNHSKEGEIKSDVPKTVRSILGGEEGSILEAVHGEYEFDNFTVKLHEHRGVETKIVLRYGKNITDLNATDDIANVYTGILPYWKGTITKFTGTYEDKEVRDDEGNIVKDADGETVTRPEEVWEDEEVMLYLENYKTDVSTPKSTHGGYEANVVVNTDSFKTEDDQNPPVKLENKVVWSDHTTDFAYPMAKVVDFSSEFTWEEKDKDGNTNSVTPNREQVIDAMIAASKKYVIDNNGWKPASNVEVSFVNLWDTEEYKDVAAMERVNLCDTVTVRYPKLNVDVKMKVVKTVYNVLLNRYDSVELGEAESNLDHAGSTISSSVKSDSVRDAVASDIQAAVDLATQLITGGLGGYVVINKNASGKPNEILIMDSPNKSTAVNVIRMNKNGIGFSNGKGYSGPYESAWTIDGSFNANFITTGELIGRTIRTGSGNGNHIVITGGEASIKGVVNGVTKSVIDMAADGTGYVLIDANPQLSLRTNKLVVSNKAQGDVEGTGNVATNRRVFPIITAVDKKLADGTDAAIHEGTVHVYDGLSEDGPSNVYCTLPVILTTEKQDAVLVNGIICGTNSDGSPTTDRIRVL